MPKKVNPIEDGPAVRAYRKMLQDKAAAAAPKPAAKKAAPAKKEPFSVRGAINARKKTLDSI